MLGGGRAAVAVGRRLRQRSAPTASRAARPRPAKAKAALAATTSRTFPGALADEDDDLPF